MKKKPTILNLRPTDEDWEDLAFVMQHHKRGYTSLVRWLVAEEKRRILAATAPDPIAADTRADF